LHILRTLDDGVHEMSEGDIAQEVLNCLHTLDPWRRAVITNLVSFGEETVQDMKTQAEALLTSLLLDEATLCHLLQLHKKSARRRILRVADSAKGPKASKDRAFWLSQSKVSRLSFLRFGMIMSCNQKERSACEPLRKTYNLNRRWP
jgi:hypothetical protein